MARREIKVVVPSESAITESLKLSEMTENQVADEYLSHPPMPYNQEIVIDKIGVLNFDVMNELPMNMLRYGVLRHKKPDLFPVCQDPEMDYEDEEQVCPIVIISGNTKFRTDQMLWFPLCDIVTVIMGRQAQIGRKLLPCKVFIDEKNQWLVPLMNLGL